jgi:hypothetical protein
VTETRFKKPVKSAIVVAFLSLALVACGSDDDADGNTGSNNAPSATNTTEASDMVEGAAQTDETPTPRPTIEFKVVAGTPITDAATPRTGSDGSMSVNASPEASPQASPEDATPESN